MEQQGLGLSLPTHFKSAPEGNEHSQHEVLPQRCNSQRAKVIQEPYEAPWHLPHGTIPLFLMAWLGQQCRERVPELALLPGCFAGKSMQY